jgi:uncharacterized protein (TIGR02147 family)
MNTKTKEPKYRKLLKEELEKRCEKNSNYSLRAYAKLLKISPGLLSEVINGKKPLSFKLANRILERLDLTLKDNKYFLDSVVIEQKARDMQRRDSQIKGYKESTVPLSDLSLDYYKYISEWYYVTILEMTTLNNFKNSTSWIASELGISNMEVKLALERLKELGLLEEKNGCLTKCKEHLRLKEMYTATSSARRKKQKQIREKAIEAIDSQEISKRSMTSLTLAIDPDLVPEAKKKIEEFNESMCKFFDKKSKNNKKKVYVLEVGLFSLQN